MNRLNPLKDTTHGRILTCVSSVDPLDQGYHTRGPREKVLCGPRTSWKFRLLREVNFLFFQIQWIVFKIYFKSHASRESLWVWDPCPRPSPWTHWRSLDPWLRFYGLIFFGKTKMKLKTIYQLIWNIRNSFDFVEKNEQKIQRMDEVGLDHNFD